MTYIQACFQVKGGMVAALAASGQSCAWSGTVARRSMAGP